MEKLAQSVEHNIRTDAYNHVQKLDISWFENKKLEILQRN